MYIYMLRSEVVVLEREHAVKVEALQAFLLEVRMYVSSYYYICVLILLYVCPHVAYMSMLSTLRPFRRSCSMCVCMCPHSNTYVSSYYYISVLHNYMCVVIQQYMCPHTTIHASSYYYTCVLILLYI